MVVVTRAGCGRRPVLLGATQVGVRCTSPAETPCASPMHAPVLRDDRSARRVGDVLEPLGDVPVVVDEVLVVVRAARVTPSCRRRRAGSRGCPTCPARRRWPTGSTSGARSLSAWMSSSVTSCFAHPELRLRSSGCRPTPTGRMKPLIASSTRLFNRAWPASAPSSLTWSSSIRTNTTPRHRRAASGTAGVVFLHPSASGIGRRVPRNSPIAPRDQHVVARRRHRVSPRLPWLPGVGHDRARAVQERVVAEDDGVTVDLEEHRPQVRLGAAEAVTLLVGEDVVERQSGPQWRAGHVDHLGLGQGWSVTLRSSTATREAFHGVPWHGTPGSGGGHPRIFRRRALAHRSRTRSASRPAARMPCRRPEDAWSVDAADNVARLVSSSRPAGWPRLVSSSGTRRRPWTPRATPRLVRRGRGRARRDLGPPAPLHPRAGAGRRAATPGPGRNRAGQPAVPPPATPPRRRGRVHLRSRRRRC